SISHSGSGLHLGSVSNLQAPANWNIAPFHNNSSHGARFHTSLADGSNIGSILNLASARQNFVGVDLGSFSSLNITVGGHSELVTAKTKLTAAEAIAAEQVLAGGQTITIGKNGTATGGSVTFTNNFLNALDRGGGLASLTVAKHVNVADDV